MNALQIHADCFLHSLRGCLRMPDADWQVYQETRSCRLHRTPEGTGGAAWGQESKSAFLSLGHTPGRSDVMGISLANVANSPSGRRAWVCSSRNWQTRGILGTAGSAGTKGNASLWCGWTWARALLRAFIKKEGTWLWATAGRWHALFRVAGA